MKRLFLVEIEDEDLPYRDDLRDKLSYTICRHMDMDEDVDFSVSEETGNCVIMSDEFDIDRFKVKAETYDGKQVTGWVYREDDLSPYMIIDDNGEDHNFKPETICRASQ